MKQEKYHLTVSQSPYCYLWWHTISASPTTPSGTERRQMRDRVKVLGTILSSCTSNVAFHQLFFSHKSESRCIFAKNILKERQFCQSVWMIRAGCGWQWVILTFNFNDVFKPEFECQGGQKFDFKRNKWNESLDKCKMPVVWLGGILKLESWVVCELATKIKPLLLNESAL